MKKYDRDMFAMAEKLVFPGILIVDPSMICGPIPEEIDFEPVVVFISPNISEIEDGVLSELYEILSTATEDEAFVETAMIGDVEHTITWVSRT